MKQAVHFIAVDLGAASGRIMHAQWDGRAFAVREVHRFANGGVRLRGGLYWDMLRIWSEIQAGLAKFHTACAKTPAGIAVDAWGVDFGLLEKDGRLLGNPRHYRDARTDGVPQKVFEIVPERTWFAETGVRTMAINTLFQLYSMVGQTELNAARTLLMIPDLCTYFLCGEKNVEWTEAATTQMYAPGKKDWAREQLNAVGIPAGMLPQVIHPGTVLSPVSRQVANDCGFARTFPAIAVGSHDTASAVAAIPNLDETSVFLSSGTWSLMGVELPEPNMSDAALRLGFTNEGGADGAVLFLKNITGLWIVQECQQQWKGEGHEYSWQDLQQAAESARALGCLIDPDAHEFQTQCDMPRAIRAFCAETGQAMPGTVGEIVRCAFESLSLKYRSVFESLRRLTGRPLKKIHVVGGGGLNQVLCQMTADACGCEVICGVTEASTLGNVMLQAVATGHLADVKAGRAAIADSVACTSFEPRRSNGWDARYEQFVALELRGKNTPVG